MQHFTLKHFVLQQRTISLYRQAVRATRGIPDPTSRKETIKWIRSEFERNRHAQDVARIEENLASMRRHLRQILPGI